MHPSPCPAPWDPPETEPPQAHHVHPVCCTASTATTLTPTLAPQEHPARLLHRGRADPAHGSAGRDAQRGTALLSLNTRPTTGTPRAGPAGTAPWSRGLQTPSERGTEHRPPPPTAECEHLAKVPAALEKQVKSGSSQQIHKFFFGPGHSPSAAAAAAAKCPQGTIAPHETSDRYQRGSRGRIYSSPAFGHPSELSCCGLAGTDHTQAAAAPSSVARCRSPSRCPAWPEHGSLCPRGRADHGGDHLHTPGPGTARLHP